MVSRSIEQKSFLIGLIAVCFFYLGFELFFNAYAILSVDEFWFAHRIYQYKDSLPYRDFAPYKTVLGYYLLLVPMLFSHGIFGTLIAIKNTLALLNAFIILISSLWLSRYFNKSAILISLCLLVFSELFLSYSTNIRVDLLGYWFCFFSLLFLLENRFMSAGFWLGLGFITTQKAIWYIFASNCALAVYWLIAAKRIKTISFMDIIRFNLITSSIIVAYILFWTWIAGLNTVMNSIFYEASVMYHLTWYDAARALFWSYITLYNPLLFLLWPLTFISILVTYTNDHSYYRRLIIVIYALAILLCLIPYKQVFPYYMQVNIPILLALYTVFFDWLLAIFSMTPANLQTEIKPKLQLLVSKPILWLLLITYIAIIILVCSAFQLPMGYLLICSIPILLGFYLSTAGNQPQDIVSLFYNLIATSIIFVGGVYSLSLFAIKLLDMNGAYQKANVRAVNALLKDGGDYVAGIELIYNKTQPIAGMRHLMGPAVDYLYTQTDELRSVMLASLYADPNATASSVINDFKKSSVKFYVNNYRMNALPASIKNYLNSQYEHYWGSIYLYAPYVSLHQKEIYIKFSGQYLIESKQHGELLIDNKKYLTQSYIYLQKGSHAIFANFDCRFKLILNESNFRFESKFKEDAWDKLLA